MEQRNFSLNPEEYNSVSEYKKAGRKTAEHIRRIGKEQTQEKVVEIGKHIDETKKSFLFALPEGVFEHKKMKKFKKQPSIALTEEVANDAAEAIYEHVDAAAEQMPDTEQNWEIKPLPKNIAGIYSPKEKKKTMDANTIAQASKENKKVEEVKNHENSHEIFFKNLKSKNAFQDLASMWAIPAFRNALSTKGQEEESKECTENYFKLDGKDKMLDYGQNHWIIEALNCIYDTWKNGSPTPKAYQGFVEKMQSRMSSRGISEKLLCELYEDGRVGELSVLLALPMKEAS